MPIASRSFVRGRLPAFALALLLQGAAVWLIISSLVTPGPPPEASEAGTRIVLLPFVPPLAAAKIKRPPRQNPGPAAITPYFNPYTFNSQALAAPKAQGLGFALSLCDVGKYDMAPDEIRAACDRIGALIKQDPGHFGFAANINDPHYWQRELTRRDAPYLAPCMAPGGVNVLYTLYCIYDTLAHGYNSEKRLRYSE